MLVIFFKIESLIPSCTSLKYPLNYCYDYHRIYSLLFSLFFLIYCKSCLNKSWNWIEFNWIVSEKMTLLVEIVPEKCLISTLMMVTQMITGFLIINLILKFVCWVMAYGKKRAMIPQRCGKSNIKWCYLMYWILRIFKKILGLQSKEKQQETSNYSKFIPRYDCPINHSHSTGSMKVSGLTEYMLSLIEIKGWDKPHWLVMEIQKPPNSSCSWPFLGNTGRENWVYKTLSKNNMTKVLQSTEET